MGWVNLSMRSFVCHHVSDAEHSIVAVNYFIVSQTIPYITTILQMKKTVCSSGGLYLKVGICP